MDDLRIEEIDAISYLLFGKNSSELTYGEKSQIGQSKSENIAKLFLVKQLTNQLINTLQHTMNLDVIEFKEDSNWRQASIVIGKYITSKLFLSYQRDFASNQSSEIVPEQIFLEYELNKYFFLQSTKGSQHNTGFDLFWKIEK